MALPHPTKYLLDWFVRYTKNRDLVFRKISEIKEEGNKAIVKQKDGKEVHHYVEPFLEDAAELVKGIKEEHTGLVVYNTRENFEAVVNAWKELSGVRGLTVYFVNPFSKLEKRWIVNPHVHSKISEAEALEEGLNSMYVMVEPITKEDIKTLTK
jgi:hypothetical protein